ncbi:hypothetical protein C0Q70_12467 [Pomacea canaliculata]|uniref:PLAT domain-containing protein n=1 Tax=Pomacea canaliculata TaxID=400727 RepID=A0A2T7P1L9_POMCA|nr:hypothetical protein C0Q70_12467 [Pomacea canaliculata]
MLLTSLVVFPWTDCCAWELKTDIHEITVENGVEYNIDFFLTDYRSLNVSLQLIVQHQSTDDGFFITKCQIEQSPSGVCQLKSGPCECMGESSGSYRYRLRMTFTEQDGGQWLFHIANHGRTLVDITVIQSITSSHDHQSTEPAQVTGVTPIIQSYTLSTTTLVILIIIVIVVFIIISLVAVFRCHSNTHRPVLGKAAECLSLEIKGGQSKFTFAEGVMSDILFYVNNNNRNNSGITLYVSKDGQRQDANVCKYVLTNTTCVNHSLSCECHTNSSEGRVEYIFQKKFQVNDSGEWVFEVWDRGVSTSVYITVQDIQSTMAPTLAKLSKHQSPKINFHYLYIDNTKPTQHMPTSEGSPHPTDSRPTDVWYMAAIVLATCLSATVTGVFAYIILEVPPYSSNETKLESSCSGRGLSSLTRSSKPGLSPLDVR